MREVKSKPPNYAELSLHFPLKDYDAYFTYGELLYNPKGAEIPEDVWIHEAVHQKQQSIFTSPGLWWSKYSIDRHFRLDQELEAYAAQYAFVKKLMPKVQKEALFDFASNLSSSLYGTGITHLEAENAIRSRAKLLV